MRYETTKQCKVCEALLEYIVIEDIAFYRCTDCGEEYEPEEYWE